MREYKFRIWDKNNNKWFCKSMFVISDGLLFDNYRDYEDGIHLAPSSYEVTLSTGLKDKNDTDIYEGDIVDTLDGNGKVIFEQLIGSFAIEYSIYKIAFPNYLAQRNVVLEVIGNIYENPELLEEGKHE